MNPLLILRTLAVAMVLVCSSLLSYGQYHFQGLKGVTAEYGLYGPLDRYYGLGVQYLFNTRFHLEVMASYQPGSLLDSATYLHYDVGTRYEVEHFDLNETINYSFLRLFRRLYLNVGVGLSQGYERNKSITDQQYIAVEDRLEDNQEPEPFDPEAVTLEDKIRFGGHANLLAELYLHRYVTLVARHRLTYWFNTYFDQVGQQTTAGIRINF